LEQAAQGSGGVTIPGGVQKHVWMWHVRTQFSGHGGDGLTVGLDDLSNLNDSMILRSEIHTDFFQGK